MKHLYTLLVAAGSIFFPVLAWANTEPLRDPFSYSPKLYGLILGISLLGGFVAFMRRVRKGETEMSISGLIGELAASAFAGMIAFWLCGAFDVHPLITAAVTGMSGHAGSSAIAYAEKISKKWLEKRLGLSSTDHAPLDDK